MVAESLTTIALLAVIVEVVTNAIKGAMPFIKGGENKNGSRIAAAVVGIILCISTHIGILQKFDIGISQPIIDYIITGIIISRGSNAVHDIISVFDKQKTNII
ncbi:hypothetical protein GM661_08480 [Iocasia frigidifontis]|uniref:Holin n=1 Tax=Iocasia fonsfrigidae TaxID=2682810 RepID=A0A8A7KIP7_9FIRM|nr:MULTISPECIES: hypothetical protein [Halanaerobiaceae]AZO95059.1 hypothetical protein D7D81_10905 [Halocella sp. SP3-1]MTI61333.1 hypothetical protein [Bacillota bacterium]QTL98014.1 hypothetical protein GM661_08480 [Iocasia fonsfrigidae]